MGARIGHYETPLGCYFQAESQQVHISCNCECYDCAKAGARHTCVKAVHSIKQLVVGLSYPMPLRYSAKAALSYIAAGSRSSCGLLFYYS